MNALHRDWTRRLDHCGLVARTSDPHRLFVQAFANEALQAEIWQRSRLILTWKPGLEKSYLYMKYRALLLVSVHS